MEEQDIKSAVKKRYGSLARGEASCCGSAPGTGTRPEEAPQDVLSKKLGYSEQEIAEVPEGANLGLGCGNPVALASLREGEVVVDLGSGAGFDCFLASPRVGKTGRVIGVDMTAEMLEKARKNAKAGGYHNVEFRLGEIENLPVADCSVDVVISNCVINLSPDKPRVFSEAYRILKRGGRLMVSDLVLLRPIPKAVEDSLEAYTGCIAGAWLKTDYLAAIRKAGFGQPEISSESKYPIGQGTPDDTEKAVLQSMELTEADRRAVAESVVSVSVRAVKA